MQKYERSRKGSTSSRPRRSGASTQIRSEIYRTLELLGADPAVLAAVGRWGDTLGDAEVLRVLKQWNEAEGVRSKYQPDYFFVNMK